MERGDGREADAPRPGDGAGCTRRRLLNGLLASGAVATGGAVTYPLARFLLPPEVAEPAVASVVAGKVADFPLNSGKIFKMGSKPGLLVRLPDGEFRAFSAVCTHLSCRVQYRSDSKQIWCACHAGFFDLTGRNVAGPPPRPLEVFDAHVRGDEVVVSRRTQ
jgi:cytochrome b6-f complex iron-sulfur subunit